MLIGTAGALAQGVLLPLMVLVFGGLLNTFTSRASDVCTLNLTSVAIDYCPTGYVLTTSNFFSSLTLV